MIAKTIDAYKLGNQTIGLIKLKDSNFQLVRNYKWSDKDKKVTDVKLKTLCLQEWNPYSSDSTMQK